MQNFSRLEAETQAAKAYLFSAPVLADVMTGRFSLDNYVRFLQNAYHHVRHTVPLLMAAGSRLPDRLHWLQPHLKEYIDEEIGHDAWILNDLEACGVDRAKMAASQPEREVEVLVSYVYDYINRINPIGMLGMVHVLEGTSTSIATETARRVQDKLGLPNRAFSYLRSHGELDKEHVLFFQQLVNQIEDPVDLNAVIHVANRTFYLYGDVIRSAGNVELSHVA